MNFHEHPLIIADDQYLITESLQKFLLEEFSIRVLRIVTNKHDLISTLTDHPKSLLIIDYNHIDFNGLPELRKFLQQFDSINILVLTNSVSRNELIELNTAGVKNIVLKTADRDELSAALRSVLSNKKYFCQEVLDLFTELHQDKGSVRENMSLTHTEIEIVKSIADGYTTKQIAGNKHISFHTVMTHRKNIFRKLNVNNASELVMFAIRSGIINTIEYNI